MYKVDKLISADNFIYLDSPSFSGITKGICKGDIWVDNIQNPTIALVYSYAVGSYSILGNSRNTSIYEHLHSF